MVELRTVYADVENWALRWSSATLAGTGRMQNEDSVLCRPGLFAIADGMGGLDDGAVASSIAVSYLADLASHAERAPSLEAVHEACRAIDRSIVRETARRGRAMGTTLVGAILAGGAGETMPTVFHVGDSRGYVRSGSTFRLLTDDHVRLEPGPAIGTERSRLTRYLGVNSDEPPVCVSLAAAPARLLLCSDGVHGEVPDATIADALERGPLPEDAVGILWRALNGSGRRDDASMIVIDLLPRPAPREGQVQRVVRSLGFAARSPMF